MKKFYLLETAGVTSHSDCYAMLCKRSELKGVVMKLAVKHDFTEDFKVTSCPEGWSFKIIENGFQLVNGTRLYTAIIDQKAFSNSHDILVVFSDQGSSEVISHKVIEGSFVDTGNDWACSTINNHMLAYGSAKADVIAKLTSIKDTQPQQISGLIDDVIKSLVD